MFCYLEFLYQPENRMYTSKQKIELSNSEAAIHTKIGAILPSVFADYIDATFFIVN